MAKKKITVKDLEAARKKINKDDEDANGAKVKSSVPAVLENLNKAVIKAAEGKTSAPSPAGFITTLNNKAKKALEKSASLTAPVPPTVLPKVSSAGLLHPEIVNKYLQQGMEFAKQGPQSRMQIANSLLGFDIGDYANGDVKNLDMDALEAMSIRNQHYIDQHRQAGTFDFPEFLTEEYISLPSKQYLTEQQKVALEELNKSKKMDEEARAANTYRVNSWQKWSDMQNRLGEMTEENAPWFYAYADYLTNGDLSKPFDMDAYDAAWNDMDDDAYWADMEAKQKLFEGLDWATLTDKSAERTAYESQTPDRQAKYNLITNQLNNQNRLDEMRAQIRNDPNYESISQYQGVEPIEYTPRFNDINSMVDAAAKNRWVGNYSDLPFFINSDAPYSEIMAAGNRDSRVMEYIQKGYHLMSPEDVKDYTAWLQVSEEAAAEFLDLLTPRLQAQKAEIDAEVQTTMATNPWLAAPMYAASVAAGLMSPLQLIGQGYDALAGEDNPNAAATSATRFQQNVRNAQEEWIGEAGGPSMFGKTLWQWLYGGASGAIDNAARIGLYGPTGSLWAAGAQSASGSLHENANRDDMSGTAKIVQALLTGGMEIGTEKIGLDALFDKGKKNAFSYIKGVIGAELGEEALNYLSDDAIDAAVSFIFDHEADIKSAPEFWQGLGETAITTLISSALMGGGGAIAQEVDNRQTGEYAQQHGDPEKILEIAKSMPADSAAHKVAADIEAAAGKGKKLSLGKLGKVVKALTESLNEEYTATVKRVMNDAITKRLVELGTALDKAVKNADAIRKITAGEKLTPAEQMAVSWDDNASQVVREITRDMVSTNDTDSQRTGHKWLTDAKAAKENGLAGVKGKMRQFDVALTTKDVSKTIKDAAARAAKKVEKPDGGKETAKMTDRQIAFDDGTEAGEGKLLRFEDAGSELKMVVETQKDGNKNEVKVGLAGMTQAKGGGTAGIIEAVNDINETLHPVSAAEANALLAGYDAVGGDVAAYVENYERAYLSGYSGVESTPLSLDPKLAKIARDAGAQQAEKDEAGRLERAKGRARNENVSIGWIGEVDSDSQIMGLGDPDALAAAKESMTEEQRNAADLITELCREFGANAVLYASKPGSAVSQSGRYDYDAHSDTFYFDINAGANTDLASARQIKNGTLGAALPKFVGHEFTHFMQINSAEGYANYARAVKNALNERGQDVAVLMRNRIDQAIASGRKLTLQEAEFEVIAHASEYMLQDSKFTDSMDDSLKGRFRQFIKEFGQKIRNAFAKLTGGTIESRALREQIDGVYHYVNDLQKLWDISMTETGNRPVRWERATGGSKANSLFALKDSTGNDISIAEKEIKSNKEYVANMPPIVSLNGNPFAKNPDKVFKTMAHEYLGDDGIMAYNDRLGQINIGMDGIEHLIGSLTNRRSAMLPAIKDVVENGRIIEYEHHHKGYWYDTAVIAGVISLDGVQYYMGVAVRENDDGSTGYYVHDAVFVEKNKSPLPNKSGLVTAGEKAPTLAIILSELANYNSEFAENSEKSGMRFESDALGIVEDLETPDGKSLFSLRSMQEDYDTYRQMLADNGASAEEIDALFEIIDETMRIVESERGILDFGWNVGRDQRSFNPVKQNSDPLYKVSLDFSSLCRKRLLQQAVQERLEAKYDTVLTKAERVAIRNELMLLREEGKQIEVARALCYVESARLKSPAQIQRFFDDRRAVMVDYFAKKNKEYMQGVNAKADELIVKFGNKPGAKKGELNSFQKKAVENLKQSMYKTYAPSADEEAIIKVALDLPGESFRSADGLWKLKKEHEEIFDAYTSFVRNATKSKGIEGDEAWWAGDSQSISDNLIAKMNSENGLRSQSWSDFQVIHLLDYMAAVIELSTRNAKMQTYTKVPDFVKLMGDTGAMINLSLIPKGFDGTLNYDPIEGMPIEDALALRRDFPNTAGTICIGITDKHIRLLLANDDIDYVIPYHASSLDKKTRQQMGMKVWDDFTNYQNEKQRDYSNTVKDTKTYHKKPSFSEWFDYDTVAARAREVGANMAMQEAAERYIDLCHRRGLQEKFAQFAKEPNYWKLLIDRKMINQATGEIIQQKAVQPRFDLDRIKGILQGEVDRFKAQNQDFNEAVDYIEQKWENGEIRKAAKSKKVQDAVKAFEDTVTVRNIIESTAEMDRAKSLYAPREVDEFTTRDYLAESDDSIAETVEERNALTIYQNLLKNHAAASEAVMAAEQALEAAPESQKVEASKTLSEARAKQRDLYNRLLNVERTAHVQSVISRTNQFMTEELQGKTREAVEKAIADREAKIAELKADLTGLKGAAKTQREADIRQRERIVARYKSKAAQMVLENSEKYQRQIADIRLRRDINIKIGKKTRHIKRVVKALNDRIVHEEDYKNVKEPLKPAVHTLVRTFLDGFGNLVFDQKTADKLKSVYDVLSQDDATVEYYDDEVSDWLTTLAKLSRQDEEFRAGGATLESLNDRLYIYTTLSDIADHVAHMVTAADTMFMEGRKASVSGVTEDIGNTLLAKKDRPELAGALGKVANFVDNLIIRGNMMPQFFFEGLNNNGMMQLYDGLQSGVRMYSERLLAGENFLKDAMRRYGYHTWRDMKKTVEYKTKQGHVIHLNRENMMWIYATAKREASNPIMDTHHLDEGGFVYEESSAPTNGLFKAKGHQTHHKIMAEDVSAITNMLTAEQIAFMDECVEFLSTECADWGNEASMQLFGVKKYKEGYYFPFKVDSGQLYKSSAAGSASTTNDARVKHISFSHSIKKGANAPLVMGEFTSVIADHINQMATYSCLVVPIENMNRVLNRKVDDDGDMVTIRSLLGRKHGSPSSKYVDDLLRDLNGGPQTDNRGTLDAGIRLFKKNAVVGKMSVAIQQPTAIARAFAYISPRWFANLHMERPKDTWSRMMKYSGTAVLKDVGGFNVGLGQGAKSWVERGDLGDYLVFKRSKFLLDQKGFKAAKDEWVDFLTGLPGWMDKVAWISIWNAAENEQAHLHPDMDRNSDEFLQMVGRRFDDIINHTQVYDSILSKSQNMRSKNSLAKMATSFMAESTLNMNLAYRAFASRDVKQIGKVVSSLLLNAALGAATYALVGAWNKDDDDRTWEEKYAVAFAGRLADNLNPMASIPYLSDIWNKIQGYDVERTDLSYVLDLAEDGMKFLDKLFNPDEALSYRDYENFVGGLFAAATGIPAKNWMGDARRVWNMTHTKTEDAPSARVWYGILDEILPGRGTNNTAYYERLLAATMDGDKQEQYDLKDYLMSTKGVKEDTVRNGVVNAYKNVYLRGGISKKEAADFLYSNDLVKGATADKKRQAAFKKVDEWDEGSDDYSVYNTIFDAVKSGNSAGITKGIKELTDNGYVESDVVGGVRTLIRESYMEGAMTQSQVKTAYKSHFAPKNFDVNDQNEWYWLFKELDWGKKNGNSTDGYSNYIFLKEGFTKYSESTIRSAWSELTSHGYEDDDVKTYVRTYILKPMVQEGKITTSRATELLNRWASYKKDSDNINKPQEWLDSK